MLFNYLFVNNGLKTLLFPLFLHHLSSTNFSQAGLRNIEEEAAPELHRAISGQLLNEEEINEANEGGIFRVRWQKDR